MFKSGKCTHGDKCKYRHVDGSAAASPAASDSGSANKPKKNKKSALKKKKKEKDDQVKADALVASLSQVTATCIDKAVAGPATVSEVSTASIPVLGLSILSTEGNLLPLLKPTETSGVEPTETLGLPTTDDVLELPGQP